MLLELYQCIVRMCLTCNASTMSAGCAHRLCFASSIWMLHTWGAVIACVQFSSFPIVTTLPEGNVGYETALSTDHETDPKNSLAFSYPCFCIINAYLCLFTYLVHLFVCAILFCWGVSRATFLTECGGNLPCLFRTHRAHFLREGYLTFYLVDRLKTSFFPLCLACARDSDSSCLVFGFEFHSYVPSTTV